jgi:hypothetical protein
MEATFQNPEIAVIGAKTCRSIKTFLSQANRRLTPAVRRRLGPPARLCRRS